MFAERLVDQSTISIKYEEIMILKLKVNSLLV